MIDFTNFEARDDSPIYLQILDFVKRELISGRAKDQDVMPSRRVLSSLLGVNPNTIQKSYKLMEEQGLISSSAGAKSHIQVEEATLDKLKEEMIQENLSETIKNLKHMGISKERSMELIDKYWKED